MERLLDCYIPDSQMTPIAAFFIKHVTYILCCILTGGACEIYVRSEHIS